MRWASAKTDKTASKPLDRKPSVPLDKILNLVAAGAVSDDIVLDAGRRLTRLDRQIDDRSKQRQSPSMRAARTLPR